MNYERDGFGTLNLCDERGHLLAHHDPSDRIAFAICDGAILKHGAEPLVRGYIEAAEARAKAAGIAPGDIFGDMTLIAMAADELDEGMIGEINACLSCTGRAAGLAERLTRLHDADLPGPR